MNSLMNYLVNRTKRNHPFRLGRLEIPGNPVSLGVLNFLVCNLDVTQRVNILEVGVFAGASSITMAKALLKRTSDFSIIAVDPWENTVPHWSKQSAYNINLSNHELFRCLVSIYEVKNYVHEFSCRSSDALPLLRPGSFDLIYVDGFHGYSTVLDDLRNASHLVRTGGILCGDDYDCTLEYAQSLNTDELEKDHYLIDKTGVHPGVVLAVNEAIGHPQSSFGSAWAFRRTNSGFEEIDLRLQRLTLDDELYDDKIIRRFHEFMASPSGLPGHHPFSGLV